MAKNNRTTDSMNFNPQMLNKKTIRVNHMDYDESSKRFII